MKKCPSCATARPYLLSDGRLKCRRCGHRFSWTSVWDSVRLSGPTKHRLLEMFYIVIFFQGAGVNFIKHVHHRNGVGKKSLADEFLKKFLQTVTYFFVG